MDNVSIVKASTVYIGDGSAPLKDRAVIVKNARIAAIMPLSEAPYATKVVETEILAPGFIDLQLNGAGGRQFNDDTSIETIRTMDEASQLGGTAWFMPTFITDHERRYQRAIAAVERALELPFGVVGVHLEGPFLSPGRPGIHPVNAIRKIDEIDERSIAAADAPVLLTLAPEEACLDRIERLSQHGVTIFAGHSEANYETLIAAHQKGLQGVTHLFNAMSQMQNRNPGIVGATFDHQSLFAGIIADGFHVHEANLRSAFRQIGPSRLFLVTDAMSPLGTDSESFDLLGKRIYRKDGKLTSGTGVLAGADISMIDSIKSLISITGCKVESAIQMATMTPAKAVRLEGEIGSISVGKRAGFTLLNNDLSICGVIREH